MRSRMPIFRLGNMASRQGAKARRSPRESKFYDAQQSRCDDRLQIRSSTQTSSVLAVLAPWRLGVRHQGTMPSIRARAPSPAPSRVLPAGPKRHSPRPVQSRAGRRPCRRPGRRRG